MVNNSGLISGLVAQSELTQLLDEIYEESNYQFDALYKIHDLAFMRRRRVLQESCAHTSPVEVEQVQGTVFGDLYTARCPNCGALGTLQATAEEAQEETLKRWGLRRISPGGSTSSSGRIPC